MKMMTKFLAGAAIAAAMTMSATASNAVAIVNGSFEQGPNPGSFTTLANGSTAIAGWVVGGFGIDYIGNYWQAADGVRSIDLSGNGKGSISQLLSGLSIGQVYTVSFSLAGNPDGGSATKVAVVSDDGSQADVFSFVQAGNTKADMGWTNYTFDFTAMASTAHLTFAATQPNAYGPALDNVSISGGVPEPATWGLMIMGFGGVGGLLRNRRRQGLTFA